MTRKAAFIPFGVFLGLVALFALPLLKGTDPSIVPSAMVGKPVPAFTLSAALSDRPGLSDKDVVKGPVLVNFFSSWCLTCVAEHKLLERIAKEDGVAIYGIDYKDKKPDIAAWISRHGNPYKAVGFDAEGRVAIDWGVYGVPETYIVTRDGKIAYRFVGAMTDDDYANTIKPQLEALKR
jgi:cytochrome c biogenesis protein CcmG, thiol:disulfide interchange protein DsbE